MPSWGRSMGKLKSRVPLWLYVTLRVFVKLVTYATLPLWIVPALAFVAIGYVVAEVADWYVCVKHDYEKDQNNG
jgi:hypothetical protein